MKNQLGSEITKFWWKWNTTNYSPVLEAESFVKSLQLNERKKAYEKKNKPRMFAMNKSIFFNSEMILREIKQTRGIVLLTIGGWMLSTYNLRMLQFS